MRRTLAGTTALLTASLLLGAPARSQEPPASAPERVVREPLAFDACVEPDRLGLCLEPRQEFPFSQYNPQEKPSRRAAPLTRFTRLAGMFMGRVPAAWIGQWQVRFDLSLR